MKRLLLLAGALLCAALSIMAPAFAAEAATISVPYGEWISTALQAVAAMAVPVVAWAFRALPASIAGILRTAQVDQLLEKAIAYAINATAGATKDKTLDLRLSNQVVAAAVAYVVNNGPGWVTSWLGGTEGIRQRVIARLDVAPEVALK